MFFIDANIFLELVLDDKRSIECERLFLEINKNKTSVVTSDYIFYACLLHIEKRLNSIKDMEDFVTFVDNIETLKIHSPNNETVYNTFEIMKKYKLDFDDALVIATMKSLGIGELVSFDTDFDRVKEIERIEPVQILANN